MSIIKRNVVGNFSDYTFDFIAAGEGFESQVYFDSNNIPTIGYGFALALGNPGTRTIRSDIGDAFDYAGITYTSDHLDLIEALIDLVNSNDISGATSLLNTHNSTDDPDGAGPLTAGILSDLDITETQGRLIYDYILDYNLSNVRSLQPDFDDIETAFADSKELVALYDLAYRRPDLVGDGFILALFDDKEINSALVGYVFGP